MRTYFESTSVGTSVTRKDESFWQETGSSENKQQEPQFGIKAKPPVPPRRSVAQTLLASTNTRSDQADLNDAQVRISRSSYERYRDKNSNEIQCSTITGPSKSESTTDQDFFNVCGETYSKEISIGPSDKSLLAHYTKSTLQDDKDLPKKLEIKSDKYVWSEPTSVNSPSLPLCTEHKNNTTKPSGKCLSYASPKLTSLHRN